MRKSNTLSHHYRPGTSRTRPSVASFRQQMTDYAKGDVLRALRADKRMSRENVAAEVGVTTKTLFTWEKQNGAIKWDNARSLASFYNVEPESLVTRDPDEAAGLPSREQLDRIEAQLAEHIQHTRHVAQLLEDQDERLKRQDAILKNIEASIVAENAAKAEAEKAKADLDAARMRLLADAQAASQALADAAQRLEAARGKQAT